MRLYDLSPESVRITSGLPVFHACEMAVKRLSMAGDAIKFFTKPEKVEHLPDCEPTCRVWELEIRGRLLPIEDEESLCPYKLEP